MFVLHEQIKKKNVLEDVTVVLFQKLERKLNIYICIWICMFFVPTSEMQIRYNEL
jgi:hypothetical protein